MLKFTQCKYTCWIFIDVYVFVTTTTVKIQKVPINLKSSLSLVVVQSLSCIWLFVTPWTTARQAFLFLTISQSLPKFMSIEKVKTSNHLILCCSFLLISIIPSIRVSSNELAVKSGGQCIGASASVSVLPMSYSGLISLRIDWFDLLSSQGILKNLLQHQIWKDQFFSVQSSLRSNSYIHTWLLEKPWLW